MPPKKGWFPAHLRHWYARGKTGKLGKWVWDTKLAPKGPPLPAEVRRPVFAHPEWLESVARARTPQEKDTAALKIVLIRLLFSALPPRKPNDPWRPRVDQVRIPRAKAAEDYLATMLVTKERRLAAHRAILLSKTEKHAEIARAIREIAKW